LQHGASGDAQRSATEAAGCLCRLVHPAPADRPRRRRLSAAARHAGEISPLPFFSLPATWIQGNQGRGRVKDTGPLYKRTLIVNYKIVLLIKCFFAKIVSRVADFICFGIQIGSGKSVAGKSDTGHAGRVGPAARVLAVQAQGGAFAEEAADGARPLQPDERARGGGASPDVKRGRES
jgi:hypothetical protein